MNKKNFYSLVSSILAACIVLSTGPVYAQGIQQKQALHTIIIDPVNIDKSARIRNSIIGPNVSIGHNAIIENSILRESIIGPDSEIKNSVLHDSLIGNEASLRGLSQSLNLGDSTEINYE